MWAPTPRKLEWEYYRLYDATFRNDYFRGKEYLEGWRLRGWLNLFHEGIIALAWNQGQPGMIGTRFFGYSRQTRARYVLKDIVLWLMEKFSHVRERKQHYDRG